MTTALNRLAQAATATSEDDDFAYHVTAFQTRLRSGNRSELTMTAYKKALSQFYEFFEVQDVGCVASHRDDSWLVTFPVNQRDPTNVVLRGRGPILDDASAPTAFTASGSSR